MRARQGEASNQMTAGTRAKARDYEFGNTFRHTRSRGLQPAFPENGQSLGGCLCRRYSAPLACLA